MFTGIVQAVGRIAAIEPRQDDIQLRIDAQDLTLSECQIGDSIAVNGVCLTVTEFAGTSFCAHVSQATLAVTSGLDSPQAVNLEQALRLSDRLGGHLVSGHVDGIGIVTQLVQTGDCWLLEIEAPNAITGFIAQKGSVAINGVSLTVNQVIQNKFQINLIPHTWQHTTFHLLAAGHRVNIEVDQIARYVARMHEWKNQIA